jgi:hypothetical protein
MEHSLHINNYRPAKTYSYPDLFRDLAIFLCIIGVIYAFGYLWVPEKVMSSGWLLPVLLFAMSFFEKTGTDRLLEFSFDTDNKEVVLSYKSMFSEVKKKRVSFNQARIEMVESNLSKLKFFEPLTLYLLKGKMEMFQITRSKDGLPLDDLKAIVLMAERKGIPIIRK